METFWIRLNGLIKLKGYSQRSFALKCGMKERRIETLSQTFRQPDLFEIVEIAKNLDVSVEFLITGKLPDPNSNSYRDAYNALLSKYNNLCNQIRNLPLD